MVKTYVIRIPASRVNAQIYSSLGLGPQEMFASQLSPLLQDCKEVVQEPWWGRFISYLLCKFSAIVLQEQVVDLDE